MMFYECIDDRGSVFDCVTSMKEARMIVRAAGGGQIVAQDIEVSAETIKRLLGQMGGFAKSVRTYDVKVKA